MKRIVLLGILALLMVNFSRLSILATDAKILFEIRPEINYVTHLYTLAGLGFSDEGYTARYGNTLPKAAIDTLQKYSQIFNRLSTMGITAPTELYRKETMEYLKQIRNQ